MKLESKDDQDPLDHIVIPLHEEQVSIGKREVVTGRVKVSTVTHSREELVEQLLRKERVEIERVPVGQVVEEVPQVREEGDVTIIPVVEETVFIERRLVLKEEVRIRRIQETQNYQECVVLRRQEAVITRVPGDSNQPAELRLENNSTRKEEGTVMNWEKVVTAYDSVDKAKNAFKVLQNAGIDSSDMSVIDRTALGSHDADHVGLWRRLFGENVWEHEAAVYGDTLEKGGAILAARVPKDQVARVMALLDVHQPLDVHAAAAKIGETVPVQAKALVTSPIAKADARDSETLRLAEEQLNVGKRAFDTGTTRIRRFVTERPVQANVTLHEEHAEVVRKAITDPAYVADIDWSDKAYEVTETAEEAVVSKSARVVEEVTLRKAGTDRVETVKDTVRRQEVEVERTGATNKK